MKIEFESINGLVDGILGSGVSAYEFASAFLGEFNADLTKGVAKKLKEWDERNEEQTGRMNGWEERYTLDDIPRWLSYVVVAHTGTPIRDATMKIVHGTFRNSEIRKCFAWDSKTVYFNKRAYRFLVEQFYRKDWITLDEFNQWKAETGIAPVMQSF